MNVIYRFGKKYGNVNVFLRILGEKFCLEIKVMIDLIQFFCGGCRYCIRVYINWLKFIEDVDDVVFLGKKVEKIEVYVVLFWLFSNDKEVCD